MRIYPMPACWWLCAQGWQVPVRLVEALGLWRMALTPDHTSAQGGLSIPSHTQITPHHTNEDLTGISEGELSMPHPSGEVISESLLSKVTKDSGVNN